MDLDPAKIGDFLFSDNDLEKWIDELEEVENINLEDIQTLIRPLIHACRRVRDKERAADLAERILYNCLSRIPSDIADRFQKSHTSALDTAGALPYPDQAIYTTVMSIVGDLRSEEAARRVNRLIRLMTAEYRAEFLYLQHSKIVLANRRQRAAEPSMGAFKALLRAWSVSGTAQGAMEAENVLIKMEELSGMRPCGANNDNVNQELFSIRPPDVECYNMVLSAYSKVPVKSNPGITDRAFSLFRRMRQLEKAQQHSSSNFSLQWFTCHALLSCVRNAINATDEPFREEYIDELMQILSRLTTISIPESFLHQFRDEGVHPRAWALGIVVAAKLHKTRNEAHVQQANTLVLQMVGDLPFAWQSQIDEHLVAQLWPSQPILVVLAEALARANLPEKEQALERIHLLAFNSSFSTLHHFHKAMRAWETSRHDTAPHVVQKFLDKLDHPSSGHIPSAETFSIAMHAWLRSKENQRAVQIESLFHRLHSLYKRSLSKIHQATETHVSLTIRGWADVAKYGQRYEGIHGHLYGAEHACAHLFDIVDTEVWDPRNFKHYSTCMKAWGQQRLDPEDIATFPSGKVASLLADLEIRSGESPGANFCNMVLQACLREDISPHLKREAYEIAMTTFNKGSHDPFSFILAVEIIKRYVAKLENNHLDFIESIVQSCRQTGRLTQTLLYEAIEVLGKDALMRQFHFTKDYADKILEERSTKLQRKGKKLQWIGPERNLGLNLKNLPFSWRKNTESSKPRDQVFVHDTDRTTQI